MNFSDNASITLGTSNDFIIKHDGSNSKITGIEFNFKEINPSENPEVLS